MNPCHPQLLSLGLGLRAQAQAPGLQALWQQALRDIAAQHPQAALHRVAVLQGKENHPALLAWLQTLAAPVQLRALAPAQLAGQAVASHSPRILARYGTSCVAEACALAGAGAQARLLLARQRSPDGCATLALAIFEQESMT